MSLRAILGGSGRVKKKSSKGSSAKRSSPAPSAWSSSLPRRKPGASGSRAKNAGAEVEDDDEEEEEEDYFGDKLDDYGLVKALATDMNLRDSSQAIAYIRSHMFSAIPAQAAGMNSTRIAETLNFRKKLPPIVTVSHIQTLLSSHSAVEREIAELARAGFIRKIVVARRGDIGETLVLSSDLDQVVGDSPHLDESTKQSFRNFLQTHPGLQTVNSTQLSPPELDQLVRAGFLTADYMGAASVTSMSTMMNIYARPEDRGTLTSLETVSRQPTGTVGTTGGAGAVLNAGGSGGGARAPGRAADLRLAVPGNGSFLKLLSSALEHLVTLLGKSRFKEAPETVLRERWDGGISKDEARHAAKRSRREFAGVLPGQTRKWKQYYGLSFDWILQEAVGSGLVEVFETRSVGRGVRVVE